MFVGVSNPQTPSCYTHRVPVINLSGFKTIASSTVHDLMLFPVLEHCPRLTAISLSKSRLITDDTLHYISRSRPSIKRLIIDECPGITDRGIIAVIKGAPGICLNNKPQP
jgi:hypothetical protein